MHLWKAVLMTPAKFFFSKIWKQMEVFLSKKSSHKCSSEHVLSTSVQQPELFPSIIENRFRKGYLYKRQMHFRIHRPTFLTQFPEEKILSTKYSSAHLE